jgi:predicted dithiol-disulfide oxidoreductase (DUF899 family)
MDMPRIVSREEWLEARKSFLVKEKEAARARDRLNAERRELPMVEVTKEYVFDGPDGTATLLDLFEGRRQLIVRHFMFDPSWDEGCPSCSFMADDLGPLDHLHNRNTSLVFVSRAPQEKLATFRERMGWTFPWYSSFDSDFNYDFHVTLDEAVAPIEYNYRFYGTKEAFEAPGQYFSGELSGTSVFLRDDYRVFHTYSTYARGDDLLGSTHDHLDLTPLGRQEEGLPYPLAWARLHDSYPESA